MMISGDSDKSKRTFFKKAARRRHLRKIFKRNNDAVQEKSSWQKRLKKASLKLLFVLIILAAVTLIFFDQMLYFAIITLGSNLAGVDISMDKVETSLRRGDIKIINLRIGNPEGFSDGNLAEAASIYISIDKSSLFSEELIFSEIEVRNLSVHGEINAGGMLNLQQLSNNIRLGNKKRTDSGGQRIIFSHIRLDNLSVSISDDRNERNITGSGISLRYADVSVPTGRAELNNLKITPPKQYSGKLLELNTVEIQFTPDIFRAAAPEISSIKIDGLQTIIGLAGENKSSIHEIFWNCNQLFFPDDAAKNDDSNAANADNASPNTLSFDKFSFKNVSLTFHDAEYKNSIHGFGVSFEQLQCSLKEGSITLSGLQVTNPEGFNRNMLRIKTAEIKFVPDSIYTNSPEITMTTADSIHTVVGFNENSQSNLHAVYKSLEQLLMPWNSDNIKTDEQTADSEIVPVIGNFKLSNIVLDVWDIRKESNINGFGININQISGSVKDGRLNLAGLQIDQPAGYTEDMLNIKTLDMQIVPESIGKPVVVIKDLQIDGMHAIAGLKAPGNSNIREVADTVMLLCYPIFAPSIEAGKNDSEKNEGTTVDIQNCVLKNCSISVHDSRKNNNIQGFSIAVGNLSYNHDSGNLSVHKFQITNPDKFHHRYLMTVESIYAGLKKHDSSYHLKHLEINELHGVLEYNAQGRTNFHEVSDALFVIFKQTPPCLLPDAKKEKKEAKETTYVLDYYRVKNSSLQLWDPKTKVPLKMPLGRDEKNYTMVSSDTPILESWHEDAVSSEKSMKDITHASKVMMYLLNATAESGIDFLWKTTENGSMLIQKLFNLFP